MNAEVAVVGLGLIGTGALRHLALAGRRVVGIGPGEPIDNNAHEGPFASHYDSGRITRRLDARHEWAVLASRSIDQYGAIETASGIRFHNPAGLTFVRRDPDGIANQRAVIADLDLPVTIGSTDDDTPPHYWFPNGWTTLTEPGPAGAIDPRQMIRAQLIAAEAATASIVREPAITLDRIESRWRITTSTTVVETDDVVLTLGPYLHDLLPFQFQASVRPEAVVLGMISDDEAQRLAHMPSVIYLLEHPLVQDVYLCPPVRYPDGRFRIKMGGSSVQARPLETAAAKHSWMTGRDADAQLDVMVEILTTILPTVSFERFEMNPCMITDTSSGLPFVDKLEDGLYIAAGGNGHAAKSADAIGALIAGLVLSDGVWTDDDLDRDAFAVRHGNWSPPDRSRHGN